MSTDALIEAAEEVQRCYPLVYLACHVQHMRRRSTELDLSAQDSSYLGHLDRERPTAPRELARHLGIADSTLSAFIKRMQDLGYVERRVSDRDRREAELHLTDRGDEAIRATSVLDRERLLLVMRRLAPDELARAVDGLRLLARACRAARAEHAESVGAEEDTRRTTCNEPNDEEDDT